MEAAALNKALGQDTETVRLFREIDDTDAPLAARCWIVAKDEVLAEKQYDLVRKYFKRPLWDYDKVRRGMITTSM